MIESTDAAKAVAVFTDVEIRQLAEREHERQNSERLQRHWCQGERNPKTHQIPFLVPWRDLEPKWQSLDESAVAAIIPSLSSVGWSVRRA